MGYVRTLRTNQNQKKVPWGMAQDQMQYGQLVEDNLRNVVRTVLERTAENGLIGDHHFYIGFKTRYPGVEIPENLGLQYPEEMTIVIQHKFWGLEVGEDAFEITLSFSGQGQRLFIPFQALTSFLDPSVQFGLQFGQSEDTAEGDETGRVETAPEPEEVEEPAADSGDNVVTLDQFRKD